MRNGINIYKEDTKTVSFFAFLLELLPKMFKNIVHLQYSDWCTKS